MFQKFFFLIVLINLCVIINVTFAEPENDINPSVSGIRVAYKVYEECSRANSGFVACLKKKAITFFDRVAKMDTITLADGINLIKNSDFKLTTTIPTTESELEKTLPRNVDAQEQTLNQMLLERIATFFSSRTIKLSFPPMTSQDLSRSVEEGRGKMKKMMGMMMAGFAMKMAALVPLAIAGLFILAGKALITAKIALLLASIIGLKKLLSQKGGGGGHHEAHGGGWQSGGGGWDRRSFADDIDENHAQNLAYNGYISK